MAETGQGAFTRQDTQRIARAAKTLILSPAVVLAATAVRLLIVCHYNVPTAISVATSGGVVNALLGTTTMLIAKFLPLITLLLITSRRIKLAAVALTGAILVSPAYASIGTGFREIYVQGEMCFHLLKQQHLMTLWSDEHNLIGFLILAIILACWDIYVRRRQEWESQYAGKPPPSEEDKSDYRFATGQRMLLLSLAVSLSIFCSYIAISTVFRLPMTRASYSRALEEVWLPAEKIGLKSGTVVVGYVVNNSNNWFVILINSSRTIDYIPASIVMSRSICRVSKSSTNTPRPLIDLATASPRQVSLCPPA